MPRSDRDTEFAAFVRGHRFDLVRFATLLSSGDAHRAEDLVQTALARLYVAWPRVVRAGTPVGYTRKIIVNAHVDETRRPWRRERTVPDLPDRPDPFGRGPDESVGGAVRQALADLPAGMRAAVVLRHWLDLSVEETADLMGVSTGTVKSQTAKGVARLKVLLEGSTGEPVTVTTATGGTR
jgi:RNA polymerase sigma-70 factor (sigma-E family)